MKLDNDIKYIGCSSGIQDVKRYFSNKHRLFTSVDGIFKMDNIGEKSRRYMSNITNVILINELLSVVGTLLLWL